MKSDVFISEKLFPKDILNQFNNTPGIDHTFKETKKGHDPSPNYLFSITLDPRRYSPIASAKGDCAVDLKFPHINRENRPFAEIQCRNEHIDLNMKKVNPSRKITVIKPIFSHHIQINYGDGFFRSVSPDFHKVEHTGKNSPENKRARAAARMASRKEEPVVVDPPKSVAQVSEPVVDRSMVNNDYVPSEAPVASSVGAPSVIAQSQASSTAVQPTQEKAKSVLTEASASVKSAGVKSAEHVSVVQEELPIVEDKAPIDKAASTLSSKVSGKTSQVASSAASKGSRRSTSRKPSLVASLASSLMAKSTTSATKERALSISSTRASSTRKTGSRQSSIVAPKSNVSVAAPVAEPIVEEKADSLVAASVASKTSSVPAEKAVVPPPAVSAVSSKTKKTASNVSVRSNQKSVSGVSRRSQRSSVVAPQEAPTSTISSGVKSKKASEISRAKAKSTVSATSSLGRKSNSVVSKKSSAITKNSEAVTALEEQAQSVISTSSSVVPPESVLSVKSAELEPKDSASNIGAKSEVSQTNSIKEVASQVPSDLLSDNSSDSSRQNYLSSVNSARSVPTPRADRSAPAPRVKATSEINGKGINVKLRMK